MKTNAIQSIKGFKDILPSEIKYYKYIEKIIFDISNQYAINELRLPFIEKSELFMKSIGYETLVF